MKKLSLLTALTALMCLTSCGGTNTSAGPKDKDPNLTDVTGGFKYEEGLYTSKEYSSLAFFNNFELSQGYLSFEIKIEDKFANNGVVLDYSESNNSYYFFGSNMLGKLVFTSVEGDQSTTIKTFDKKLDATDFVKIEIFQNPAEEYFEFTVAGEHLDLISDITPKGTRFGFFGGSERTQFKSFKYVEGPNQLDNDPENYYTASGSFDEFTSTSGKAILVNNKKEFSDGVIKATMTGSGVAKDNGIIFGLSRNGTKNFWETGVSYYFFFLSTTGLAFLGRIENAFVTCQNKILKKFDAYETYELKVIKNGGDLYCFVNNELCFHHTDINPLTGTSFGLRCDSSDVSYSNIEVINRPTTQQEVKNLDVVSGNLVNQQGLLFATENKTLALEQDELVDGTITTTIIPGIGDDAGIVFRLTKPNSEEFYENESGLSYYWFLFAGSGGVTFAKYKNGLVTRLADGFLGANTSQSALTIKIVMNGGDFYCYMDGRLSVHFHDDEPLTGGYYGYKCASKNLTAIRIKTTDVKEHETYDHLIFGHSYTEFWYNYEEDFAEFDSIGNMGIGGSIAIHWTDVYKEEVVAYAPKMGIYWIGINDLTGAVSPQVVTNQTEELMLYIKSKLPDFECVLYGPNRCPARSYLRNEIHQLQVLFEGLEAKYDWIYVVDTELMYCNKDGDEIPTYFTDGLHPSNVAYGMAARALYKKLGIID